MYEFVYIIKKVYRLNNVCCVYINNVYMYVCILYNVCMYMAQHVRYVYFEEHKEMPSTCTNKDKHISVAMPMLLILILLLYTLKHHTGLIPTTIIITCPDH